MLICWKAECPGQKIKFFFSVFQLKAPIIFPQSIFSSNMKSSRKVVYFLVFLHSPELDWLHALPPGGNPFLLSFPYQPVSRLTRKEAQNGSSAFMMKSYLTHFLTIEGVTEDSLHISRCFLSRWRSFSGRSLGRRKLIVGGTLGNRDLWSVGFLVPLPSSEEKLVGGRCFKENNWAFCCSFEDLNLMKPFPLVSDSISWVSSVSELFEETLLCSTSDSLSSLFFDFSVSILHALVSAFTTPVLNSKDKYSYLALY